MKNTLLVFVLMVWSLFSYAQIIDIPDANFKSALLNNNCVKFDCLSNDYVNIDLNKDGEIQIIEAENVCEIKLDDWLVNSSTLNNIQSIEGLFNFTNLKSLKCMYTKLSKVSINNLLHLSKIDLGYNTIEDFNLNNLPQLDTLILTINRLSFLELNNLPNLKRITCDVNRLSQIKLLNLPNLIYLDLRHNNLSGLDISLLVKLNLFLCTNNQITNLNLNNNKELIYCSIGGNPLETLFLKTNSNNIYKDLDIPSSIKYICTDDDKINYLQNKFPLASVNSYCSFVPGGKLYSVQGKSKLDKNNNGCDFNVANFVKLKFNISSLNSNGSFISNSSGNYYIPVQEGTHTIKPILENPEYFNISPDSITVTFPTTSDTIIQNFCITPKGIFKQVDLSIIPLTPPARPGFDASYKVVMTNKGNQVENGTLYFSYDEAKMDFVSTDVNPSTQSDGLLSWDFTDLLPFETRYFNVTFNVNSPGETPPVNAGDELLITCNILDNVFLLKQEVVGSYDPNDKTCLEGKTITPEQVGEYVHYLIRFENTGNYAAENVVVKDVIDETTFDISTLQITDASHEAWARINGNVVEFIFENIQLPFDDATNDGYICFKIKTKPTLVLGNELKNEANIYFDYNLPILTNMTNTVVANLVGTDEAVGESDIEIYPNPVSDVLKFSGYDKIVKVEIFDMSGRLVQVSSVVNGEVNVERLLRGVYLVKLFNASGVINKRFTKM